MKLSAINKVFTDKVAEYIANGYVLNPLSMNGHQGELGKVDLVKGSELIRVCMVRESHYDWKNKDSWYGDTVEILVGRWDHSAEESAHRTVWMDSFENLETVVFYELRRNAWYVGTLEEAMEATNKKNERRSYHIKKQYFTREEDITDKAREIGIKYLKNVAGYCRVSPAKVKVIKKSFEDEVTYHVVYSSHDYKLR